MSGENNERVVVDKKLFLELLEDSADLYCLKEKGVAQWSYYGEAMVETDKIYENLKKTYLGKG